MPVRSGQMMGQWDSTDRFYPYDYLSFYDNPVVILCGCQNVKTQALTTNSFTIQPVSFYSGMYKHLASNGTQTQNSKRRSLVK